MRVVVPVLMSEVRLARWYFAAQAIAGASWWVAVFGSDDVRRWTLGELDAGVLAGPDLVLFVGASAVAALTADRRAGAVAAGWTVVVTVGSAAYGLVEREAGWGVVLMVVATVGTLAATSILWFGALPRHWFFVGPFSFRVAAEGSGGRHLRRSLVQLVLFWSTFFLAVPVLLAAIEDRLRLEAPALEHHAWDLVGIAAFALASGLGLWACTTMALVGKGTPLPSETARELVVAGPYRIVRNPMAVAGAIQTIGVGLWVGAWSVVAIAIAGAVAWDVVIRPGEEADLAARFGSPYDRYRAAVRCWVPARPA